MPMTRVAVAGLGAIGRVLVRRLAAGMPGFTLACAAARDHAKAQAWLDAERIMCQLDRKSTRLNSSHVSISYAVFCLKKKNETYPTVESAHCAMDGRLVTCVRDLLTRTWTSHGTKQRDFDASHHVPLRAVVTNCSAKV